MFERLRSSNAAPASDAMPPQARQRVAQTLQQPGQALDQPTRQRMETHLGADFSRVRIHADSAAAASAQAVQARAYTAGHNLVFGAGQYAPATPAGQRLLTHELSHVVQQGGQSVAPHSILPPHHPAERQAKSTAQRITSGQAAGPLSQGSLPAAAIAREHAPAEAPPANASTTTPAAPTSPEDAKEAEIAFGSFKVPWLILEPLILNLPSRWQSAYKQAHGSIGGTIFDPALGRALMYKEMMAFFNLLQAGSFAAGTSQYGPQPWSKSLSMAESLSGVSDTYINLVSLALHIDLDKYLSTDVPNHVKANLGWVVIYGLLAQGGLIAMDAGLKQDIDFTSLLGVGLKSFSAAPRGMARPFNMGNSPDPRWASYPFWSTPGALSTTWTGRDEASPIQNFNVSLGLNLASFTDLYPKTEQEKQKYKGFELFPYFSLTHSWAKDGQSPPPFENRYLAGAFIGNQGFYTLIEGGQQRAVGGQAQESYGRIMGVARDQGPLSLFQFSNEYSYRPETVGLRTRLNAAASIKLLDNDQWQMTVGAGLGGLFPTGDQPGALDVGGQFSLYHKTNLPGGVAPFRTGVDVSTMWRPADPFDAKQGKLWSLKGGMSLVDLLRVTFEMHQVQGAPPVPNATPDTKMPQNDFRIMFAPGPGVFNF